MDPTSSTWKHLGPKSGSVYRQLFVKGRNIAARTLYGAYMSEEEPRTPEQIAHDWNLPLDVVREAIAYCKSDPPEIRSDLEREAANAQGRGSSLHEVHGIDEKQQPKQAS
jgi:hypothetical protein